jgi:hypothetical protein
MFDLSIFNYFVLLCVGTIIAFVVIIIGIIIHEITSVDLDTLVAYDYYDEVSEEDIYSNP